MKQAKLAAFERETLDRRFKKWKRVAKDAPPKTGWVREIRETLGMSSRQLGRMLGVCHQAVTALERAEAKGDARLKTLRKAAKALHCDLVYALVPKKPIREILRGRAFGMIMMETLLAFKKLGIKATVKESCLMINTLIEQRKMLDNPRLLWNEPRKFKEIEDAINDIVSFHAKRQAQPVQSKPASPEAKPKTQPEPPEPYIEPKIEERMPIEEEIAQMPPAIQELARMGKVRV